MKILVIRNDKLGDFVQAFPAFAMLKASNPELKLTALVPAYTAPLAQISPYLDDVIIDSAKNDKADFNRLVKEIKEQQFDGMISFFSNTFHFLKVRLKINVFFFKNNSVYRQIKNGYLCIAEQVVQQQVSHYHNMLN